MLRIVLSVAIGAVVLTAEAVAFGLVRAPCGGYICLMLAA